MTAEIAILNKTAVALAADSAVTISAGTDQHKIFDSADKLFELTRFEPIAIMINNDMSFMEAPLPVLIKEYRETAPRFSKVIDAARHFLAYLDQFAKDSPESIKLFSLDGTLRWILDGINETARTRWFEEIIDDETDKLRDKYVDNADRVAELAKQFIDEEISNTENFLESLNDAEFVGDGPMVYTANELALFEKISNETLVNATDEQKLRGRNLLQTAAQKRYIMRSSTGAIFAGFGSDELFPTLVSYQIQGVVGDRLKFVETSHIDIDRNGPKARVIPFAQREMVERFLYGLDTPLRDQISEFCKTAVPKISEQLLKSLDLNEADLAALTQRATVAERAFFEGLAKDGFEAIQRSSEAEIEDMVEFMPKPEMARMAEALVNLTSIKRRVSRGSETVGGPIDVAIISKAEGFVWVSRKHYFPRELNERYFTRISQRAANQGIEGV